jgi:hypothetical protein
MEKRDPEPSLHTCAMGVWSSDFVEHLNCSSLEEVCFSVWSICLQPNPVSSSITDMNDPDSTHRHDWPRLRPHTDPNSTHRPDSTHRHDWPHTDSDPDSDHTQTQTPKHTDLRSWIKEENVETG